MPDQDWCQVAAPQSTASMPLSCNARAPNGQAAEDSAACAARPQSQDPFLQGTRVGMIISKRVNHVFCHFQHINHSTDVVAPAQYASWIMIH